MRAVIQRVSEAAVSIEGKSRASINDGLLVLLGIEHEDSIDDVTWLSGKICRLRVFKDGEGIMNHSVRDIDGEILLVSQFTLHASTKKGNRPAYIKAARPEKAIPLYEAFTRQLTKDLGKEIKTGEFGAMMNVSLTNTGPVTIIIDSKTRE